MRRKFRKYLKKDITTVHMDEMKEVEGQLNNRSIAQIRTKLNNMKLGKCTLRLFVQKPYIVVLILESLLDTV